MTNHVIFRRNQNSVRANQIDGSVMATQTITRQNSPTKNSQSTDSLMTKQTHKGRKFRRADGRQKQRLELRATKAGTTKQNGKKRNLRPVPFNTKNDSETKAPAKTERSHNEADERKVLVKEEGTTDKTEKGQRNDNADDNHDFDYDDTPVNRPEDSKQGLSRSRTEIEEERIFEEQNQQQIWCNATYPHEGHSFLRCKSNEPINLFLGMLYQVC